jgi:N-acetylneuraminic acid mutarotase
VPAIESQMLSWQLNSALSRSVVLPAAGGSSLIVAGGLEGTGAADQGVYEVNVSTGAATQVGNLVAPLQDAAGAVLAGKGYIFGGGAPTPLTTVQLLPNLGSTKQTTVAASVLEPLAEARSDAATVTIGRTAYLIGGYDGTDPDAAVLATTDGSHFSTVVNLPVPVRDPAVAEVGGRIYVFGGDAITGAHAGEPVATVQMIDTAAHHAAVVGSLPEPLAGAVAATLGGVLYVAGGETITGTGASAQAAASSSVWAWLASSKHAVSAGHLAAAVAYAGLTVIESRAWLVGGETGAGVPVRDVQTFEPKAT